MAVGLLAPPTEEFEREVYTRTFVDEKLGYWREMLLEALAGNVNVPTVAQCRRSLNTWLDELLLLIERQA